MFWQLSAARANHCVLLRLIPHQNYHHFLCTRVQLRLIVLVLPFYIKTLLFFTFFFFFVSRHLKFGVFSTVNSEQHPLVEITAQNVLQVIKQSGRKMG